MNAGERGWGTEEIARKIFFYAWNTAVKTSGLVLGACVVI